MRKEPAEVIKKSVKELLEALLIKGDVVVARENQDNFKVSIDPKDEDASLLIGYHGENLESFQLILSFLIAKELGEFERVLVNVGDYRERREEKLIELATSAKLEALEKNGEVVLPNLSSSDRRIIHLFFQNDDEASSESVGEGRDRNLVIKPKNRA